MVLSDIHSSRERERPRANVTETHTYVHDTFIKYSIFFLKIRSAFLHIYTYVSVTNNCISSTT